ncbi:MAG: TraM recognition domain-containing protein, partial [Enterocloster sp.]
AKSQLKAIYKDNADTIIGNMDSTDFSWRYRTDHVEGSECDPGKETIDMYNTGQSKGSQESYNMNYQKLGKDLMTMDELAVMDGSKCIVQVLWCKTIFIRQIRPDTASEL